MAVDQALLESVAAGATPTLRFYQWRQPCLSLGRNQPARGFSGDTAAQLGAELVRRPTGGLAVYHDRELTYSVTTRLSWLGGARATYHAIHGALAAGLRDLGIAAQTAPRKPSGTGVGAGHRALDPTCFAAVTPGEVSVAGRKLVGSAQRCERRALLQHGSLLLEPGQDAVAHIAFGAQARPAGDRAISLAELGHGDLSVARLVDVLVAAFEAQLAIRFEHTGLDTAERDRTVELERMFSSRAWSERI